MSIPQVSSSISLPHLYFTTLSGYRWQFSVIISTFLLLRAMLDKIQPTGKVRVPVCLPGQWWTLGGTPHTELSVPSFRREGGRGHEDGVMKESVWSEEWNRQVWLDSSLRDADNRKGERGLWNSSSRIKNQKLPNQFWSSLYRIYILCIMSSYVQQTSLIQTSLQLIQLVGVSFMNLAVPVFCLMGGGGRHMETGVHFSSLITE